MRFRRSTSLLALVGVVVLVGTSQSAAQRGAGRNPRPGQYDLKAEQTISGTVEEVRRVGGSGPTPGTHVTLRTTTGTVDLALGPSWYMTEKKFALAKGDQIDVIGAKASVEGGDVILVREIKKGSETMAFRNASGLALWSPRAGR